MMRITTVVIPHVQIIHSSVNMMEVALIVMNLVERVRAAVKMIVRRARMGCTTLVSQFCLQNFILFS